MDKEKRRSEKSSRSNRKPYAPPRLVRYGHVAKLTQSGGSTTSDTHGTKKVSG